LRLVNQEIGKLFGYHRWNVGHVFQCPRSGRLENVPNGGTGGSMAVPSKRQDAGLIIALTLWAALAFVAKCPLWVAGILLLFAVFALQRASVRHRGGPLLGPHLYFDTIRIARKGRTVLFRVLFLVVLLGGIGYAYEQSQPSADQARGRRVRAEFDRNFVGDPDVPTRDEVREQLAAFSARSMYNWFLLQNLAILVLAPAYIGGAIAEERERGTLEMLAASQLSNREIVLGKLAARLIHLGGLLLAGVPIFSMMLVWGGVDPSLLLVNWINSVLLLLTVSSMCLAISTMPLSSTACVHLSYGVVLVSGSCCAGILSGFPLIVDAGTLAGSLAITSQTATLLVLSTCYGLLTLCFILLAIRAVRPRDWVPLPVRLENWKECRSQADAKPSVTPMLLLSAAAQFATADVRFAPLPPVEENALLWKERYTGRRTLLHRPEVLVLGGALLTWLLVVHLAGTIERMLAEQPDSWRKVALLLTEMWGWVLRWVYGVSLGCYVIGAGFRAAVCVVRERQMKTLDPLLLMPVERNQILRAKWQGVILKGWPWLTILVCDVLVGVAIGVYHPFSVCYLLFCPWAMVLCLCSLGVLISVVARTVLQANLAMAAAVLSLAVWAAGTQFGRLLGSISLTFTLWHVPSNFANDFFVGGVTATGLLVAAFAFWSLASILFERPSRR
jgi:ABC-type transport system involved in multi-copper enzyme maturation permease subunit